MADTCGQILLGSGLTVLSHPLMYIKVLIQVGHEPLPPTVGKNLFGRQVQQLPGLFAYGKPNPANNSLFTFITLIRMCLSMLVLLITNGSKNVRQKTVYMQRGVGVTLNIQTWSNTYLSIRIAQSVCRP
ncbi:Mitochondrial carrier 2 [Ilyodon furcidens]|uniref:Mitochondrial carrier 2 n=2 Tax=Goodeidae TaxID=28758 RepID=A0ABV0SQF8_9TELE